ncbi:hypothetical protein HanRHA438_Chr08g0342921 [Helianthus annuus]|nr:hypothetical protein HanRHA438_Chr08g0342921 [Helianthus annuus]
MEPGPVVPRRVQFSSFFYTRVWNWYVPTGLEQVLDRVQNRVLNAPLYMKCRLKARSSCALF